MEILLALVGLFVLGAGCAQDAQPPPPSDPMHDADVDVE